MGYHVQLEKYLSLLIENLLVISIFLFHSLFFSFKKFTLLHLGVNTIIPQHTEHLFPTIGFYGEAQIEVSLYPHQQELGLPNPLVSLLVSTIFQYFYVSIINLLH